MPSNEKLHRAKKQKNDEFYTQYADIEKEMNAYIEYNPDVFRDKTILLPCDDPEWSNFTKYFAQNFERFGIKKLISTSYAADSKPKEIPYQPTLFETESPKFDKKKTRSHGKIFILERDTNKDKKINIDDLEWRYLKGDGDFRSPEIKKLRDKADIIITNPPFSLFREFVSWIKEANKSFIIIGSDNNISYKEFFSFFMKNEVWKGVNHVKDFLEPDGSIKHFGNISWFSNIEHGRRHNFLSLMTITDNLRFNKRLLKILDEKYQTSEYPILDNYDAIEVPIVSAIPSDYFGNMAVPMSFLDYYNPDQFSVLGIEDRGNQYGLTTKIYTKNDAKNYSDLNRRGAILVGDKLISTFPRILIKHKEQHNENNA